MYMINIGMRLAGIYFPGGQETCQADLLDWVAKTLKVVNQSHCIGFPRLLHHNAACSRIQKFKKFLELLGID